MSIRRTSLATALLVSAVPLLLQLGLPSTGSAATAEVRNGRTTVTLQSNGASYYTKVTLDDKVRGQFVIDTGASSTMMSPKMAKKLGIRKGDGYAIPLQLADGTTVSGRVVVIEEIRVGRATVYNSSVVIFDEFGDTGFDGLLGMSFLGHFTFKIDNEEGKLILYEKD